MVIELITRYSRLIKTKQLMQTTHDESEIGMPKINVKISHTTSAKQEDQTLTDSVHVTIFKNSPMTLKISHTQSPKLV